MRKNAQISKNLRGSEYDKLYEIKFWIFGISKQYPNIDHSPNKQANDINQLSLISKVTKIISKVEIQV